VWPMSRGCLGCIGCLSMSAVVGRALYSFTSQLNLSTFYVIGGARRGCVAREGVRGGVVWPVLRGCSWVFREYRVFVCVRHGSS
jgi:hypothetical protein